MNTNLWALEEFDDRATVGVGQVRCEFVADVGVPKSLLDWWFSWVEIRGHSRLRLQQIRANWFRQVGAVFVADV